MAEPNEAEAAELDDDPLTPADAMRLARRFAGWLKPLSALDQAVGRVSDTATKSIVVYKARAETSAKLAEAEGTAVALWIVQAARGIVADLFVPELVETYELALAHEIYGPLRLEVPNSDIDPDEL